MEEQAEQRFQSLWETTAAELAGLVGAMGIDPQRASDVLQDVYLAAWNKLPAEADAGHRKRWLVRVTVNRCNLEHRRKARWRKVVGRLIAHNSGRPPSMAQSDPAEAAGQSEQRQLVREALGRLEPRLRSILVLRYFAEMNSREIGEVLSMPDSTVRSHMRTARGRLAEELEQAGLNDECL